MSAWCFIAGAYVVTLVAIALEIVAVRARLRAARDGARSDEREGARLDAPGDRA